MICFWGSCFGFGFGVQVGDSLEYRFGILVQHSGLGFRFGIQVWDSVLGFSFGIQVWDSGLGFKFQFMFGI